MGWRHCIVFEYIDSLLYLVYYYVICQIVTIYYKHYTVINHMMFSIFCFRLFDSMTIMSLLLKLLWYIIVWWDLTHQATHCFWTEDCSSTSTFKGVCHILEESHPHVVILENVDSIDTPTGELDDDQEHLIRTREWSCTGCVSEFPSFLPPS